MRAASRVAQQQATESVEVKLCVVSGLLVGRWLVSWSVGLLGGRSVEELERLVAQLQAELKRVTGTLAALLCFFVISISVAPTLHLSRNVCVLGLLVSLPHICISVLRAFHVSSTSRASSLV